MAAIRQVTGDVADGTQATPAWANNVLQWLRGVSRSIAGKGHLIVGAGNLDPIGLGPPPSGTKAVLQANGDTVSWQPSESLSQQSTQVGQILVCTALGTMTPLNPPTARGDGDYFLNMVISGGAGTLDVAWINEQEMFNKLIPGHASAARPLDLSGQAGRLYLDTR